MFIKEILYGKCRGNSPNKLQSNLESIASDAHGHISEFLHMGELDVASKTNIAMKAAFNDNAIWLEMAGKNGLPIHKITKGDLEKEGAVKEWARNYCVDFVTSFAQVIKDYQSQEKARNLFKLSSSIIQVLKLSKKEGIFFHFEELRNHINNSADFNFFITWMLGQKNAEGSLKYLKEIQKLLEIGLVPNSMTLFISVAAGNSTIFEQVLNHPEVKWSSEDLTTSLTQAIEENNIGFAEALLKKGANPNLSVENAPTPLTKAIESGNDKLIRLLEQNTFINPKSGEARKAGNTLLGGG